MFLVPCLMIKSIMEITKKRRTNYMKIPSIGLGTWLIDNDRVVDVVKLAVMLGYRHIDTAQAYRNEEGIGKALKETSVPREEIFVTTKVLAELKDYDSASQSIDDSLKKLGLDYIDLILIHSPEPWMEFRKTSKNYFEENLEVWRALEDAYKAGKVKAIGVSNFRIRDIQNILDHCQIKPMVNQVLCHIGQTPFELIDFCQKNDILVEAYSPIAHGEAGRIQEVTAMADKYHVTFAQICLRYCLQLGLVALPKASSREHLMSNLDVDFLISEEDMEILKKVKPLSDYGEHDFFPVFAKSGKE